MAIVLLDTNILIEFEDTSRPLSSRAAAGKRNSSGAHRLFVHPRQFEDVERDRDSERKRLLLSRMQQYEMLESPPEETQEGFELRGWRCKNDNDLIDNLLLLCVDQPVVDLLVTNDVALLKRARRAGLEGRVMDLDAFVELTNPIDSIPELAMVKDEPCHSIDFHAPFFDSLRGAYPEFDDWFDRVSREQRRCWTIRDSSALHAICIYKKEPAGESISDTGFHVVTQVLKLCTFKVDEESRGSKLGERLLSKVFQYCRTHDEVGYVYVTVRSSEQPHLVRLFELFGFDNVGKHGDDDVFGKYVRPCTQMDYEVSKAEYSRRFFPSVRTDSEVNKFLVPIEPQWHETLFPDLSDFAHSLFGNDPEMYSAESNTVRKAYLCNSNNNSLSCGDLLFFYRSQDKKHVDAIGVVTSCIRERDPEVIQALTKSRTVYSLSEIQRLASGDRGVLVILFDYVCGIENPVSLKALREAGLSSPVSIWQISHEQYVDLFGGIL